MPVEGELPHECKKHKRHTGKRYPRKVEIKQRHAGEIHDHQPGEILKETLRVYDKVLTLHGSRVTVFLKLFLDPLSCFKDRLAACYARGILFDHLIGESECVPDIILCNLRYVSCHADITSLC